MHRTICRLINDKSSRTIANASVSTKTRTILFFPRKSIRASNFSSLQHFFRPHIAKRKEDHYIISAFEIRWTSWVLKCPNCTCADESISLHIIVYAQMYVVQSRVRHSHEIRESKVRNASIKLLQHGPLTQHLSPNTCANAYQNANSNNDKTQICHRMDYVTKHHSTFCCTKAKSIAHTKFKSHRICHTRGNSIGFTFHIFIATKCDENVELWAEQPKFYNATHCFHGMLVHHR